MCCTLRRTFPSWQTGCRSDARSLYQRKVRDGLVAGKIDAAYLTALKDGVRYWDGEQWVKEAVRIRRPVHLAHQGR